MKDSILTTKDDLNFSKKREEIFDRARAARVEHMRNLLVETEILKNEQKRRFAEEWIRFYRPHDKQALAHCDPSRIRCVLGGNRSGKSHFSMVEAYAHAIGHRPWLKEDDPSYKIDIPAPNKGLIIGESFGEQVKKVLIPKLLGDPENGTPGVIPKDQIEATKKNQQGVVTFIKLKNGSTITAQSYDQDTDLFEGADFHWAAFDEPPPRPIWIAVQRGLTDHHGKAWLAMTPLKEPWIYDQLVCQEGVSVFNFDINDNVGYGLTESAVADFAKHLTPTEKRVRLRGEFMALQGLVYPNYVSNTHIYRVPRVKIEHHWGLWMAIDPHPRTPHHALWIAIRPDERKFVCGELKNEDPNNRVEPFIEALKSYEEEYFDYPAGDIHRLIDPSSRNNNPIDGRTIWDEFADRDIICEMGSKKRDMGIHLCTQELAYDAENAVFPTLFFFDDLPGIHYEMTHYIWEDWKDKQGYQRTEKQVPRDKDDHFIECMHRIIIDEPYLPDRESDWFQPTQIIQRGANYG